MAAEDTALPLLDTASPTASAPAAGEKPSKSHKVGDYHPSAPPSSAPYAAASSQYSGVKPSKTGYQPSAPPAAGPYGGYVDPYSAGSEKPSKAQQGGRSKAQKGSGYGDPYSEKPSNLQQDIKIIKKMKGKEQKPPNANKRFKIVPITRITYLSRFM